MNTFGIINSTILIIYGLWIFYVTIKHWQHPNKNTKIKISELCYASLYVINGILLTSMFNNLIPEKELFVQSIITIAFVGSLSFLWGNIIYTRNRVKKNPQLLEEDAYPLRIFEPYWENLSNKYEDELSAKSYDIVKDLSRKALHFIILAVIIGINALGNMLSEDLEAFGLTPVAFRNLIYVSLAYYFLFMFTTADIFRVYRMEYLPDWALKWYGKSVEIKTEKFTFISSVPFLLTMMLFAYAPFELLLCTAIVSCISDSVASITGKSMGRHKMTNFGRYPHKSYEGLIAGATTAFWGIIMVFHLNPLPGVTLQWEIIFGLLSVIAFIYVDAFSKYVVDNVLNTLLPGLLIWIPLTFMV